MKDYKSLLIFAISLFIIAIATAILGSQGFDFYSKKNEKQKTAKTAKGKSSETNPTVAADSLIIQSLDTIISGALLKAEILEDSMNAKMDELQRLKEEILALLRSPDSNEDLKAARLKIEELSRKLDKITRHNNRIDAENKKLFSALDNLLENRSSTLIPAAATQATAQNSDKVLKKGESEYFVQGLSIKALYNDGLKDNETNRFDQTEKFLGSLSIKNTKNEPEVTEVYIVLRDPEGEVVTDGWDSGLFKTKDGPSPYSSRIKFDCATGELKTIHFNLQASSFQKGIYQIETFSNGKLIARAEKELY